MKKQQALQELRALVATYLEGSDDAPRAAKLLAALEEPTTRPTAGQRVHASPEQVRPVIPEEKAREMFGCTVEAIDQALTGKDPRDVAMYAMGTLSNAQELFQSISYGTWQGGNNEVEWTVPSRHANTIRQLINVAKYAIDKAVPR